MQEKKLQYNQEGARYLSTCMYQVLGTYLQSKGIRGSIQMEGYDNSVEIIYTNLINGKTAKTEISYDGLFEAHKKQNIHKKSLMVLERLIADSEIKKV